MHDVMRKQIVEPRKEDPVNADVLTTRVAGGIAVITLGSAKRIYFDEEMVCQGIRADGSGFSNVIPTTGGGTRINRRPVWPRHQRRRRR